tara:strand:- start:840 stop:1442 length:603 start_codon:yes stop_codon:yes gene_type:complete
MLDLQQVASRIHNCFDCDLSQSRTKAVPGEGPEDADLMFIGEGPGFNEDQQSRPFVGAAGQYLEELLAKININRNSVFITNMVKCRPPNNRDPFPGEIEACSKYIDEQIRLVRPKVIVTLGRHSLGKFLPGETIGKVHGKPKQIGNLIVYPIYHPAAALRRHSLRIVLENDFQLIPSLVRGDIENESNDNHKPQQLSLFE